MIDPSTLKDIIAYLDVTTPIPTRADVIFVFGTRLDTPAYRAASLWHLGIAPVIVLTGGENRRTGTNEAQAHRRILLDAGIPENRLIIEDRSTNTLENVTFALPLLQKEVTSLKVVLAVCKWHHSRRALMTLKKHLPYGVRYYANTYEQFPRHAPSHSAVLKDWENIPRYLARGHLAYIEPDGDGYI
ncbi:MAG: hypothetical protein CUN56_09175 [Phototrophicales bacterium]|nr:MAG: hypothetical protein CUN56_09175 [Phototrophicales bacterium]